MGGMVGESLRTAAMMSSLGFRHCYAGGKRQARPCHATMAAAAAAGRVLAGADVFCFGVI